ncbi:hypothetical protein [Haloterrigena alkaliphila]|uniref:Uncharacterized protein n=1 Tax=Haloterrigena alkaliphila TaxID=2816475 RepID=A0A8A2VGR6_9EURY|nr:hypothetical protein [Haloterrigena alkaliphila]QSX00712.1 hypothetical protein J0X25_07065 [Haloterrigena alkaliphila]
MRELRSCDFCGADAVGTFAVVPPELEPTEAEQRRVVCCNDCKDRLETLLEPLLARAGVDVGDRSGDESGGGETAGESGAVVASADESTRKRSRTSSPNATVSDADAGITDSASDTDGADDESPSDSVLEDGISFERNESDESETAAATQADDEAIDFDESATDETNDDSGSGDATRPPNGYGKVLRLLRNREFPMKRSAVENLAAGAYDLEADEVDAIVDHAVENGEFVEKQGKLRRP